MRFQHVEQTRSLGISVAQNRSIPERLSHNANPVEHTYPQAPLVGSYRLKGRLTRRASVETDGNLYSGIPRLEAQNRDASQYTIWTSRAWEPIYTTAPS